MSETQETPANEDFSATGADVFDDTTTTTETPPSPEPQPPPPPQGGLTAEQIRESVSAGVRDASQPAPRQYTPQELDKLFNVWDPPEDFVERIRQGGVDGVLAMKEMRDGLSKQFGTLLQYQMEVVKRELADRMNPALTYVQERRAEKDRESFFSQNEDLREHEQLTQTVFDALKAQGYKAPDIATAYKVLADRTRALLGRNGNGAGATQTGGARTTTTTQRRPAQLSSGSQAGGGGPSAPAAPFPGAEVFM